MVDKELDMTWQHAHEAQKANCVLAASKESWLIGAGGSFCPEVLRSAVKPLV